MTIKNIFTKIHGHLRSFSFTKSFNENIREYPIMPIKNIYENSRYCASHPFGTPIRSRPRFSSSWVFALTKIFTNERHRGGGLARVVDKLLKSFLRGGLGRAI